MLQKYLHLLVFAATLMISSVQLSAQVCPDVFPQVLGPASVREGQAVEYFTPRVPGHTYSWSLPDGGGILGDTTSDVNYKYQSVTWSVMAGPIQDFRVQLSETYLGCTDVKTITVRVNPLLHAYYYYEYDPTGGCFYSMVNFTGNVSISSDPTITYSWDFGDPTSGPNNNSALPNPVHTFSGPFPATFSVVLTVTNSRGFSDQITDYVYVDPDLKKATAIIDPPVIPNCLYTPVSFSGANSLPKPVTNPDPNINMQYYIWNFNDPPQEDTMKTASPVTHQFTAPGTYHVTLEVVNNWGCSSKTFLDVVIQNTIPVASFTNTTACLGTPTQFNDASIPGIGTITNWQWDFGDPLSGNNTSNLQNPTHIYSSATSFTPTLTVTNSNGCTHTFTPSSPVMVTPSPVANFTHTSGCNGVVVDFTNTSNPAGGGAITGFQWDINGTIFTSRDASFLFPAPGTYPVTLTVTNINGCSHFKTVNVVINPAPDVDFTFAGTIVPYQFTYNAIVNPAQFVSNNLLWEFGDGFPPDHGTTVTHTFPGAGTFTVRVTGTDMVTGCSNFAEYQVSAGAPPSAFFTATPPNQCQGQTIAFTSGPPGGLITEEIWDYHDGSINDHFFIGAFCCPANPTHTFAAAGPYHVTRTINPGTATEATWDVFGMIYPNPTAQFTWFSDATQTWQGFACADQEVYFLDQSFSNSTPPGNIYQWAWDFGDPGSGPLNNFSSLQNPTHIFSGSGTTYNVTLTVTDNLNNCQHTSLAIPVTINAPIPVDFTYNDFTCLDQLVNFVPDPALVPFSDYTWLWNFGDGSPVSNTPGPISHLFSAIGTWTVSLTLTDKYGCTKTRQHDVTIIPLPIANFIFTAPTCERDPIQFTDQSVPPSGYPDIISGWSWDFGDGIGTSTLQNPSYIYPGFNPAGYDVVLTVTTSRGCVASKTLHVQPIPAPVADFEVMPQTPTCATQLVQFRDLSQDHGGSAIATWRWDFGDPSSGSNNTSPAQNPTHTFANAGTYQVSLTVKNGNGCDSTKIIPVTINPLPVADFTVPDNCEGDPTIFTNTSTTLPAGSTIVSYSWDFGDGGTATVANPQHTYGTYGVKNVTLTVVNSNGCINTIQKQVTIFAKPIPLFTYSPSGCLGNPVQFTDGSYVPGSFSGYVTTWEWDFGDGSVTPPINWPNNPNITHTFPGPAISYIVRLTVTTTNGCKEFIEHTITNIPSPVANFAYSPTTCLGQSVQFTDLSAENGGPSIQTWSWNFDDPGSGASNISTLQHPTHTFSSTGPHNVTLIITSANGCTSTYTPPPIIINPLPVSDFTYTPSCEGMGTQFTDASVHNATSIVNYLWDFGDGSPTSNLQNPLHVYSTYGMKSVRLTISNDLGCIKDTIKQVLVNPKPIPAFSFTTPNCLGSTVQFTNLSTTVTGYVGPINEWVWSFGDGSPDVTIPFPGNPNVTHTFLGTATGHTVRLTVTTTTGCTAYIEHIVTSIPAPLTEFSFPASTCARQPVQFTDLTQQNGGGNILQWNWNFGDPGSGINNTSTAQSPIHLFSGPGTFTVRLTTTNTSNCTSFKDSTLTIIALPLANFRADTACLGSITTFTDQSTATGTITQHSWDFGDGLTSTQTNPTHLYSSAGVFNVRLVVTTAEGCNKDTTKSVLVLPRPIAAFNTSAPACASDSVQFTDLSSGSPGSIRTWYWDFGDGNNQTINFPGNPNVRHRYTNGGTYNVRLRITTSNNCIAEKIISVVIQDAPLANFSFNATRCALMPVNFTDLSQQQGGSSITQWQWNFGDPASGSANTSTARNPTHSFTSGSNFTVRLTVTNANGCFDSVSQVISVNSAPLAKFTSDTACVSSVTHFTDASTTPSGTIAAWLWDFGDPASGTNNSSTQQNPSHEFTSQGLFQVKLTVTNSNSCAKDTLIPVTVNSKPTAMFSSDVACIGDSTSFTDLSIAPGSSVDSWLWNFGDGGSSNLQNPKHAFAGSGVFNVSLTVTNLSGCVDSIVIPITARPKPESAFAYTSYFCPAGAVNFEDQSQGVGAAITERYWIFEPGYTSTLPNPTYTFSATDTTFAVTLIVTDNYGCKDTIIDSVRVKPGFKFTFTNDTVCFNELTHFRPVNLAAGDTLYNTRWEFGDPNSGPSNYSNDYSPTHQFSAPATYAVKLRVVNSDNCADSVYKNVTVYQLPAPTFTFVSLPCDSIIRFSDVSSAGSGTITTWEWDFGDGSPPVTIPSPGPGNVEHLYTSHNSFHVVLKVTNSNGCSDTVTRLVESYPCIKASFTHSDTLLCARYPIAFSDSSLPSTRIDQWQWLFGDGLDTTYNAHSANITHRYANSGTYIVKLVVSATISGKTFFDTISQAVTVHPTPLTQFSNPYICNNQVTLFADTSLTYGAKVISWNWNFGEPTSGVLDTSSLKNPSHKYDTSGVYDVKLVVMNKFGCKDSLTKTTRVFAIPTAKFISSLACAGNPTQFDDQTIIADTAIYSWHWNFGELNSKKDTSLMENPAYQYKSDGVYQVRLIVKDRNGCYDTADSTVVVHVTPLSAFTVTEKVSNMIGKIKLNNTSENAETYFWDFGDPGIPTSTDESPIVSYTQNGSYLIMLVSTNGFNCSDTTYFKYEVLFKGLYIPNAFAPSSGILGVSAFQPVGVNIKEGSYFIEVYDTWGHLMWQSKLLDTDGHPVESWDGKDLKGNPAPTGTYMWKANATFTDGSVWEGSDIGKGEFKTIGTVTLIR